MAPPGPRDYSVATERALYAFAATMCYFPGCKTPVIVFVDGEPVSNVETAHIRGANPGSPRYDPAMTDDERRSYPNLILLCIPHHKIVDKLHPEMYSVELLTEWKTQREAEARVDASALAALTDEHLLDLIEKAIAAVAPQRQLTAELGLGVAAPGNTLIFPSETAKDYFEMYADQGPAVVALTVRSQGALRASVDAQNLRLVPDGTTITTNDFPPINPRLPCPIEAGDSQTWLYDLKKLLVMAQFFREQGVMVRAVAGEAMLGSGETISSAELPVELLGPPPDLPPHTGQSSTSSRQ
jgi:hypothetical protein